MLTRLRTYRFLSALVAAALVVGVSLPLVQYACATTPTAVSVAGVEAQPAGACQGIKGCQGASAAASSTAAQAERAPAPCCTINEIEQVPVVEIPATQVRVALYATDLSPAKAVALDALSRLVPPRAGDADGSASVSAQLLFSVFLL